MKMRLPPLFEGNFRAQRYRMAPRPKLAGEKYTFTRKDDKNRLLLNTAADYKSQKIAQELDLESMLYTVDSTEV